MSKKPRNGYVRKDNSPNEIRREQNNNKLRGCPTPAKRSFRTRDQAIDHAAVAWRYKPGWTGRKPHHAYLCDCEMWHVTKRRRRGPVRH